METFYQPTEPKGCNSLKVDSVGKVAYLSDGYFSKYWLSGNNSKFVHSRAWFTEVQGKDS